MNDIISLISVFVIGISSYMIYQSTISDLVYVKSDFDNKMYLVRNLPDKEKGALLLSKICNKLESLVSYLKENSSHKDISRLVSNFRVENICESEGNSKYTSYSINKGDKIVLCLRTKGENAKLVDLNTLMFVAIHELGHLMTKSVGHTEEFWDNFRYLLQEAIKLNIYIDVDYEKHPKKYCGIEITDSPLT